MLHALTDLHFGLPKAYISRATKGTAGRGAGGRRIQQSGRLPPFVVGRRQRGVETFEWSEIARCGGGDKGGFHFVIAGNHCGIVGIHEPDNLCHGLRLPSETFGPATVP